MASLDSQGEIVPVELANPEETQIRKGENEPVCSFILPPLFDKHSGWYGNGQWLTSQKSLNSEYAQWEVPSSWLIKEDRRRLYSQGIQSRNVWRFALRRIFATTLTQRPVTTVLVGAAQEGSPAKSWALRIGIPRVYQRKKGKGHRRRSFQTWTKLLWAIFCFMFFRT